MSLQDTTFHRLFYTVGYAWTFYKTVNSYSLHYWCVCQTHERKSLYIYVCVFSERQDEVVYYDTFESADDIREDDTAEREELHRLQVSARQLEARRGRITAKRSYLRNKRVCTPYPQSILDATYCAYYLACRMGCVFCTLFDWALYPSRHESCYLFCYTRNIFHQETAKKMRWNLNLLMSAASSPTLRVIVSFRNHRIVFITYNNILVMHAL